MTHSGVLSQPGRKFGREGHRRAHHQCSWNACTTPKKRIFIFKLCRRDISLPSSILQIASVHEEVRATITGLDKAHASALHPRLHSKALTLSPCLHDTVLLHRRHPLGSMVN